jgi:4-phosphopantoate--beta-alanine ligase
MSDLSGGHPRYESLRIRNLVTAGVESGITSIHGLIAHGRGEAFDYLLGEKSHAFARTAVQAAAAMLVRARHPVISVNGNAAALVPSELARLGEALGAPLEVNIYHSSKTRERAIRQHLVEHGAAEPLMPGGGTEPGPPAELDHIASNRRFVHPDGILAADVVFVPLEDGDRCQALRQMGKEVVTVDLNPLSRTSNRASVTIVDNVVRAMPMLLEVLTANAGAGGAELQATVEGYDNQAVLLEAIRQMRKEE